MRELEAYKTNYISLGQEIQACSDQIQKYMEDSRQRLTYMLKQMDEKLVQMQDRLQVVESENTNFKFDIDKLSAKEAVHEDSIRKMQMDISKLF